MLCKPLAFSTTKRGEGALIGHKVRLGADATDSCFERLVGSKVDASTEPYCIYLSLPIGYMHVPAAYCVRGSSISMYPMGGLRVCPCIGPRAA